MTNENCTNNLIVPGRVDDPRGDPGGRVHPVRPCDAVGAVSG